MIKKLLFSALLCPFILSATVLTVDNNPGSSAQYSSLQTAINSAAQGDSIIIMPSLSSYGSVTINRRLYIYSRGHANNSFKVDADKIPYTNNITFNTGSSGCVVEGIYCEGGMSLNENNITIRNCRFGCYYITMNGTDNHLVEGSLFQAGCGDTRCIKANGNTDNCIFRNNVMFFALYSGSVNGPSYRFFEDLNSSNLITNCMFVYYVANSASVSSSFTYFHNCSAKFYNNILWTNEVNRTRMDTLSTGATYKNNLTYSALTSLPNLPGTNNINDKDPQLEMNASSSNPPLGYPGNNNYRLKSTSPGKNKGLDSTDIGIYGGGYNFTNDGLTTGVPIFEEFTILNPVIKQGGTLKIKLVARKPE